MDMWLIWYNNQYKIFMVTTGNNKNHYIGCSKTPYMMGFEIKIESKEFQDKGYKKVDEKEFQEYFNI